MRCCLCKKPLAANRRKRRKLHGESAAGIKQQLQALSSVPLDSLVETKDKEAYLCSACVSQFTSMSNLKEKLAKLQEAIQLKLSALQPILFHLVARESEQASESEASQSVQSTSHRRKRQAGPGNVSLSSEKRPCFQQPSVTSNTLQPTTLEEVLPTSSTSTAERLAPALLPAECEEETSPATREGMAPALSPSTSDEMPLSLATHVRPVPQLLSTQSHDSPPVQVNISYAAGRRVINVRTPARKQGIKRIARRSYKSLAVTVVNTPDMCASVLAEICRKIKEEMAVLSSQQHDSILKDTVEAVKHFHWNTVLIEFEKMLPTLMTLLRYLVARPLQQKPLICTVASQLLKSRHQQMGLVQRAVSVMLYGNGSSKEVYRSLQPLNVCLSDQGTRNIIDKISTDHDVEVQYWCDEMKKCFLNSADSSNSSIPATTHPTHLISNDDSSSSEGGSSLHAPSYSPISMPSSSEFSDLELDVEDSEPAHIPASEVDLEAEASVDSNQGQEIATDDQEGQSSGSELHSASAGQEATYGYKFIGDNVDKNTKPSRERAEIRGASHHYFHSYARRDSVPVDSLSDSPPPACTPDTAKFLPSTEDIRLVKEDLHVLLSRIIVQHMDEFSDRAKEVMKHIPSKFTKEMSAKTEVIPLGVLLQNENKLDEMSRILAHFMMMVPTLPAEGELTLPNGSKVEFDNTTFSKVLLGGDQLTSARVRGTQALRVSEDKATDRLEGIIPVWHMRQSLMKAIWKRLWSAKSSAEKGTLYQLRNLISRKSVPSDPQANMNAAEDYLLLLLHAHVVAAAETILSYTAVSSLADLTGKIIANFINLPFTDCQPSVDRVHLYAVELLSLSLIWHGYHDATREGDGERIERYLKLIHIIFRASSHHNYAKEIVIFLLQSNYLFSKRQKTQLLWSRCINTRGYQGANIPCDLHMEHLNRRLKTMLRNIGANLNPKTIEKAGKCLGVVHAVCTQFESQTTSKTRSASHPYPAFGKDFDTVLKLLKEERVFTTLCEREHRSFKFQGHLMNRFTEQELKKKIQKNIDQLLVA